MLGLKLNHVSKRGQMRLGCAFTAIVRHPCCVPFLDLAHSSNKIKVEGQESPNQDVPNLRLSTRPSDEPEIVSTLRFLTEMSHMSPRCEKLQDG